MIDNEFERKCAEYLYRFFDIMNEGFILLETVKDNKGEILDFKFKEINKAFEGIIGIKRDDVLNRNLKDVFSEVEQYWIDTIKIAAITGESQKFENYMEQLGRYFTIVAFSSNAGECTIFFIDITETKRADETLKKYQLLSESTKDIILFIKSNGSIVDANFAAINEYGYSYEELLNMKISDLEDSNEAYSFNQQIKGDIGKGTIYETSHKSRDGRTIPVEVSLKDTYTSNERMFISVIRDISERKKKEENLLYKAKHDFLTGIPNRSSFIERLTNEIKNANRRKHKIALLYFDVDKFKMINDKFGHDVGDNVLKEAAKRVKNIVAEKDFLARIGGDEFVLIQPLVKNREDIIGLAEMIMKELSIIVESSDVKHSISTSIGISIYPEDAIEEDTLIKHADLAMYEVKNNGGNRYHFYSDLF